MPEQEKLQRDGCSHQFNEVFRRLDAVEKFDRDLLDGKLDTFTQAITKFEILFSKQDETIKGIMDKFDEYRRENIEVGKQRDLVVKELSDNVMKITEQLVTINNQQKTLSDKTEKISEDVKTANEKYKIDFQAIWKNVLTTLITTGTIGFISFLIYTYAKSL